MTMVPQVGLVLFQIFALEDQTEKPKIDATQTAAESAPDGDTVGDAAGVDAPHA